MSRLPDDFLSIMQNLLPGEEYEAFLASYEHKRALGLRVHPSKLQTDPVQSLPFQLTPIPWCKEGYYYSIDDAPGRHPYHAAGLYYIQEPSAMAVAECLGLDASSIVLDLCAAPGGKSTQIASKLGKHGLLIANEIHPTRAKILSENLERWGTAQAIILNETPQKLERHFPEFFTHILVDAPCSGEGMFRKDPEACEHWSTEAVHTCVERQKEILACVIPMLKPGGVLVYSTCTFNPFENEQMIDWILSTYPDCSLEPLPIAAHVDHGHPDWIRFSFGSSNQGNSLEALSSKHSDASRLHDAGRLWPHRLKGEGHFVARIRKAADPAISHEESNTRTRTKTKTSTKTKSAKIPQPSRKLWESFLLDNFHLDSNDVHDLSWIQPHGISSQAGLVMFGDHLYASPCPNLDITGLKVVRPGVYLGECKTNRFEPGHGLALAVNPKRAKRTVNLQASSQEVVSYLRGESLHIEGERGWTLVTVDGYPIGFAKSDGKTLKNHYPKGLRWIK